MGFLQPNRNDILFNENTVLGLAGSLGAYSISRVIATGYTGPLIRVRRSSDNAELDIFATAGELDAAALNTFTGAGNAFVKIIYDQSGNGFNLQQTTAANQPKISNAGAIYLKAGKPAAYFDGVNSYMETAAGINSGADLSIYSVAGGFPFPTGSKYIFYTSGGLVTYWNYSTGGQSIGSNGGGFGGAFYPTLQTGFGLFIRGANSYIRSRDFVDPWAYSVVGTTGDAGLSNGKYFIFSDSAGANKQAGYLNEFMIFNGDKYAERLNIEANLSSFYTLDT